MKKVLTFMFIFSIFISTCHSIEIPTNAKSAILIEESTGKVLFEKNADEQLNPASMTKIMSMILVFEALDNKTISLTDTVNISKDASSMGGSQVYVNEGDTYTVEELLKGVAIASANDAVVALAEKVYGSKENFVNKMNEKAQMLDLKNTNFVNPHGLDDNNHYSSARDMAIMARELLKHKDVLKYTSKYEDYFRKSDGSSIWLVNTNKLVKFYSGMDGLKTGYTKDAGYCLTATASKNNLRLISVVMGEESIENRTEDTLKLLNYGFNAIKKEVILKSSEKIDILKLPLSKKEKYSVYIKNDIIKIYDVNSAKITFDYKIEYDQNIKLPVKKNSNIGKVKVTLDDGTIINEKLVVREDIEKISYFKLFKKNIGLLTGGNI